MEKKKKKKKSTGSSADLSEQELDSVVGGTGGPLQQALVDATGTVSTGTASPVRELQNIEKIQETTSATGSGPSKSGA